MDQLYRRIFEIEDVDRLYKEFTADSAERRRLRAADIEQLANKPRLTQEEEETLARLLRDSRLASRADEVRDQRLNAVSEETQRKMLESELKRVKYLLREKEAELERLTEAAQGPPSEGGNVVSG